MPERSSTTLSPRSGAVDLSNAVRTAGIEAGLDAVGVTDVAPFTGARAAIRHRVEQGHAADMGFVFRDPDRATDPRRLLRDAASLVVGARSYAAVDPPHDPEVEGDRRGAPAGRVARYARADEYGALRVGLDAVRDRLRAAGHRAAVIVDQNSLVDRAAAQRAGLGWFGVSSNLLLPGRGSWFVLGSVVTDAVLPTDPPVAEGCGPCRRCMDGCPTGAIVAPGVVDGRRCLAWVVQAPGSIPEHLRVAVGDRIYGCDDCQEVCPPNRREVSVGLGRAATVAPPVTVPLLELLEADDATILARHGRWYLHDRDPRWLRRTALVALGNVAEPGDPGATAVLDRYAAGDDPVLAEHARWAQRRRSDRMAG
ncbi:MAG: tRNA epoxyqueuosine(34) reductase QueG [Actinobacteria bacterium]|nr:tRNA epoxyqueuosine(34) reductase QueG [Actinomycetota bacterium]